MPANQSRGAFQNGRQIMKAALSFGLMASIVTATFPANAQEMNRAGSEILSPDLTANRSPIVTAPDAAGFKKEGRLWTMSKPAVTPSLHVLVAQNAARVQQAPPKPRDLIPSLPSRRGRCSMAKGAAIGAGIGAGVGLVAGAVSGSPNDIGGRMYPALVFGAIGAGLGAVIGLAHCR